MKTIIFKNSPRIITTSSLSGPKETKSRISRYFDIKLDNDLFEESSFEKAEMKMLYEVITNCIKKSNLELNKIECIISGDLLNQIISSSFSVRKIGLPYLGVYNACATFTESLIVGSSLVDGGYMNNIICSTISHFATAERQYRYPLEFGCIRPPQSQWTVTGGGASLISNSGEGVKIVKGTVGRVIDYGVSDANNMGAAMAPSACDTIYNHLINTRQNPEDFNLIITGDLGALGSRILKDLLYEKGFDIEKQHIDCGELVYNINEMEFQGGSGAGCSSLVFNSFIYKKMMERKYKKILLVSTGALLSTISSQQGETIPGISHAVEMEI